MTKKQVLDKVFLLFPRKTVKTIIHYGNRGGKDVDLFIVLHYTFVEYGVMRKFPLDIVYMRESFFKKALKNFDPMATDPILTGRVIYGGDISDLKKQLKRTRPTIKTTKYLLERAKTFLEWTKHYHRNNNFKETLMGIQFTLTYVYLAVQYQKKPKIITFAELLKIYGKTLIQKSFIALKKGLFNETDSLLFRTENLLTDVSDMLLLS